MPNQKQIRKIEIQGNGSEPQVSYKFWLYLEICFCWHLPLAEYVWHVFFCFVSLASAYHNVVSTLYLTWKRVQPTTFKLDTSAKRLPVGGIYYVKIPRTCTWPQLLFFALTHPTSTSTCVTLVRLGPWCGNYQHLLPQTWQATVGCLVCFTIGFLKCVNFKFSKRT